MHPAAMEYVARFATDDKLRVLDIGGRFINGSPRSLFPHAEYLSVDLFEGPGVDVVADAVTWEPPHSFDVVLCLEVFEHTESWPALIGAGFAACAPGGLMVVTCAGPGRGEHSAVDGGWRLHPGEWYRNVPEAELASALSEAGFTDVAAETAGADVRGVGWKPEEVCRDV